MECRLANALFSCCIPIQLDDMKYTLATSCKKCGIHLRASSLQSKKTVIVSVPCLLFTSSCGHSIIFLAISPNTKHPVIISTGQLSLKAAVVRMKQQHCCSHTLGRKLIVQDIEECVTFSIHLLMIQWTLCQLCRPFRYTE